MNSRIKRIGSLSTGIYEKVSEKSRLVLLEKQPWRQNEYYRYSESSLFITYHLGPVSEYVDNFYSCIMGWEKVYSFVGEPFVPF